MASNPYSTAPLPPPPGGAGTPAALHQTAVSHIAGNATSPLAQMTNGFGGRVGGNPSQSMRPVVSGGNRTSQHVATPGNNNVSYASPSLLNSANSLWQAAMNRPGSPGPANGMSYGFIKNTADRKPPPVPVAPPPATTTAAAGGATAAPVGDTVGPQGQPPENSVAHTGPGPGLATVGHNTAPVYRNGLSSDMFNTNYLYRFNMKTGKNETISIDKLSHAEALQLLQRPINQRMISSGYYYDNGHIYRR